MTIIRGNATRLALCLMVLILHAGIAHGEQYVAQPSAGSDSALMRKLNRLVDQQKKLEERVGRLERQKLETEQELAHEKETVAKLRASAQKVAVIPTLQEEVTRVEEQLPGVPATEWGSRLGYQGFPFGQRQGGFFYSVYVDHRLLGMDVGEMRYGDLSGEVAVGLGKSGSDHITVTSDLMGGRKVNTEFRQSMLSVWPTLKYSLLLLRPYGFRPYLTAGPGMWCDVVETPPLALGQGMLARELVKRKLPVDTGANIFGGVQGGAGFEYNLAGTKIPVLERLNLGFDYRYAALSAGQRFSTYSMSLSFGE